MSDFLEAVRTCSRVSDAVRIDPVVFCRRRTATADIWFTARDDGWYGWFVAQYQHRLEDLVLDDVAHLLRSIDCSTPSLFRFELNEETRVVRAVFQLPIASETRLEDDIPAAVQTLVEEWSLLVPFIDRIVAGERVLFEEAKAAFRDYAARRRTHA